MEVPVIPTIFLARDGRVASVHAGFASAATGEAHVKLQHDVDELLKHLLSGRSEQQVRSGVRWLHRILFVLNTSDAANFVGESSIASRDALPK